jgi:hypothetical protein
MKRVAVGGKAEGAQNSPAVWSRAVCMLRGEEEISGERHRLRRRRWARRERR